MHSNKDRGAADSASSSPSARPFSARQAVIPVSLGTALSLPGDASLYTVLATHVLEAGVLLASVGILLSVNRWIRLPLNGPAGWAIERAPRRLFFVPALFLGALSTGVYALTTGFWPLLLGRLLWGIAWVGIWVGGNTIVLDVCSSRDRGRWVGIYQMAFFFGVAGGAILGGLLTDLIGYHGAMGVNALIGLVGALIALLFLPETRGQNSPASQAQSQAAGHGGAAVGGPSSSDEATGKQLLPWWKAERRPELASAAGLLAVNRIATAGFLTTTLGLYLLSELGDTVVFAGRTVGVTTLTGLGLGLTTLIAILAAPISGRLSDRLGRWRAVAGGLVPGIIGFGLLSLGSSWGILMGLLAIPMSSGSNQSLSTALVGDLSPAAGHGRWLGMLYTIGDLASAIGPPLAFAILPLAGLRGVYLLAASLFLGMWVVAQLWSRRTLVVRRDLLPQ